MRAFIQTPSDRDEYAVFVIEDDQYGGDSSLLCGDGVWRKYPSFVSLDYPPFSPTVRVTGKVLHQARRRHPIGVRPLFLPWGLPDTIEVHTAIKQAAAEQECLPAWLREALA